MKRGKKIYEGKAKQVFATSDPGRVIIYYKDEATAGDGLKRGIIKGKGAINCEFSSIMFRMLEKRGVLTHFIEQVSPVEMLCWKVKILPVEVIVRNMVAGGLAKRMGMKEGTSINRVILEHDYKSDELHDTMVNLWHLEAFGFATRSQYEKMNQIAMKVNRILKPFFEKRGVLLVDYKLEFGLKGNRMLLADEITPDGCRFWDKKTKQKLDKDRFRRDMGGIEEAYQEILDRIKR
jgi:phosphoribosylaminoimidazole-succinocarboxamide synthase